MPQVFVLRDLAFESGHARAGAVADAAIKLAVAGAVAIALGLGEVGGVRDHIDHGLAVLSMASRAIAQEHVAALSDGLLGEWHGILEFLRLGRGELRLLLSSTDRSVGQVTHGQENNDARSP